MKSLCKIIKNFIRSLYNEGNENFTASKEYEQHEKKEIYEDIKKTQYEWQAAKNKFNNTTDPDQIDYSINLMELHEKKLKILYKRAKELENKE